MATMRHGGCGTMDPRSVMHAGLRIGGGPAPACAKTQIVDEGLSGKRSQTKNR